MKSRIYNIISNEPLKYSSVELGKLLGIQPDEVRDYIRQICSEVETFEYGIISKGHKYKLANEPSDIEMKIQSQIQKHRDANRKIELWKERNHNVFAKLNELDEFERNELAFRNKVDEQPIEKKQIISQMEEQTKDFDYIFETEEQFLNAKMEDGESIKDISMENSFIMETHWTQEQIDLWKEGE